MSKVKLTSGRTVVEGESPYRLAPGVQAELGAGDEESSDSDEDSGAAPGTVYRITKGQLKKLDGGMAQYEDIAGRTAARLAGRT